MKTYKVKMTRTETYEKVIEVQANNEDDALFEVQRDMSWSYPDEWTHVDEEHEITEVKQ